MPGDPMAAIAARLGGKIVEERRTTTINVSPERVREACLAVSSVPGLYHLSTITGIDEGETIALLYQFWQGRKFAVVRTSVPKTQAKLASVSSDLPSAVLYEAEIQDLLGVAFEGNPYLGKRLLLPDNYPADAPPPLRREANPEKIRRMMGLE
ncbi:MAG: NADH-quinone oxidoreductase subunit C [Thaumarchaeota archaeon]|nr:NADH-quinone oxidoreductase subunit C [Nitrososphaerota archaeon]